MTVMDQLQAASYKGFSFLVGSETTSAGKKIAVHEYPNSGKRFVEELGILPQTYTFPATVHGDVSLRLRLEEILNESGLGTLVHPIYGTVDVVAGPYSVSSNQTRIGEFTFDLTFYVSETNVTPSVETTSQTQITSQVDTVATSVGDALEATYTEPTFTDSVLDARAKVDTFFATMQQQAAALTSPITDKLSDFNSLMTSFRGGVTGIVQTASNLREAVDSTFLEFSNLVNLPADLSDAWASIIDFGSTDQAISNTTLKRAEISGNRTTVNDCIQIQALARSYEASAYTSYLTSDQLANDKARIEDDFQRIAVDAADPVVDVTTPGVTVASRLIIDPETRNSLHTLRALYEDTTKQLQQNAWRVVDIDPGITSLFLASYRYYGDTDNLELLQSLNPGINHTRSIDTVKAVTR
jgi:prophage DNA circulation protein